MSFVVVETCQIFLFDDYYCKKAILWPRKVHFWTKKQKDVIYDGTSVDRFAGRVCKKKYLKLLHIVALNPEAYW